MTLIAKFLLRQPVRTFLFICVIALSAFAFFLRTLEGLIIYSEIDRLSGRYRSIGSIRPSDIEQWDVTEGVKLIEESEDIRFIDWYDQTTAAMDGIFTPDIEGSYPDAYIDRYIHNNKLYVYGTLIGKSLVSKAPKRQPGEKPGMATQGEPVDFDKLLFEKGLDRYGAIFYYYEMYHAISYYGIYIFEFEVDALELGLPDYFDEGDTITVVLPYVQGDDRLQAVYNEAEEGRRYYFKASAAQSGLILMLRPLRDDGLHLYPVADEEVAHIHELEAEKDLVHTDIHSIVLFGLKDMTARPDVKQDYYLVEGRYTDYSDYVNGSRVCVIRHEFAEMRELTVGDEMPLSLLKYEDSFGDGIWRITETKEETFQIVGIYGNADPTQKSGTNWFQVVYVPESTMPEEWQLTEELSDVSFELTHPSLESAFIEKYSDMLEENGYILTFEPNGWDEYVSSTTSIKASALMGAVTFTAIYAVAAYLTGFLYTLSRRKEFAIMRALGVPRLSVVRRVSVPMLLIGAIFIAACAFPAWHSAVVRAQETLAGLGVTELGSIPAYWPILLAVPAVVLFSAFIAIETHRLGRRSVLELLQSGVARKKAADDRTAVMPSTDETGDGQAKTQHLTASDYSNTETYGGSGITKSRNSYISHVCGYTVKHMLAMRWKSLLIIISAAAFTASLCIMQASIEKNELELDRLYASTVVTGAIVKTNASEFMDDYGDKRVARRSTVRAVLETGFIQDHYVEAVSDGVTIHTCDGNGERISDEHKPVGSGLRGINQPELYEPIKNSYYAFEFIDGYSLDMYRSDDPDNCVVALSRELLEMLDVELGGYVAMLEALTIRVYRVTGVFDLTDSYYERHPHGDGAGESILIPLAAYEGHVSAGLCYDRVDFTLDPARNRELDIFRVAVDEIFSRPMKPRLTFVLRDEVLREAVEPLDRQIEMLKLLHPIVMAVSVLVAAGITAIVVLQGIVEVAIMRVLGTSKRRIILVIILEQALLCLIGLLAGLLIARLYWDVSWMEATLYFAGCTLSAIALSFIVTRRKPLELLQVKE